MTHLWSKRLGEASVCGRALFTHRMTCDESVVDCRECLATAALRRARARAIVPFAGRSPAKAQTQPEKRGGGASARSLRNLLREAARS